jgi:signal transduction histidine kinase
MHRLPLPAAHRPARRAWLRRAAAAAALGLLRLPAGAQGSKPRSVLIVHSFGREIAPYAASIAVFRRELASRSPEPVVFIEAALDAGRALGPAEQEAFADYLRARFSDPPPDLIVSSAGPAAQFLVRHRDAVFPGVPIMMTAVDVRVVPRAALRPGDAVVATRLDLPLVFDSILRLLPDTTTVAVVLGVTPLERFWRQQLQRDTAYLAGRVEFDWLDGLSLPQIKQRIAALPPHSAVYFGLLVVDAAGVPHEGLQALAELRQAANAPIFSIFESELGLGVVGGPYLSQTLSRAETARLALRQLAAGPAAGVQELSIGMDAIAYDARELQRWRIDTARLPRGSELRFAPVSPWQQHRWQIIGVSSVVVVQAGLIAALLLQRSRRRRAEAEARTLGGRLITAYEDEGRRLARELHDDITQRLAGLSIEAAALPRLGEPAARAAAEHSIGSELANLSRDVHALSYRLHPSVVDDLGLGEALRMECERAARRGQVAVEFEGDEAVGLARGDRALCLFRVVQEGLRNAVRHGKPQHVRVELRAADGSTGVSVVDDGCGFDPAAARERASLGLASMRERVALLGGRIEIHSRRGQGTRVIAWVPVAEATP